MRTRAYRRHKQQSKLKRRFELFSTWKWGGCSREEFWEDIMKGDYPWIRSTGRPCNCDSCTYYKYKRPDKAELKKIIERS